MHVIYGNRFLLTGNIEIFITGSLYMSFGITFIKNITLKQS